MERIRFYRRAFLGARQLRRNLAATSAPRIIVGGGGIFIPGWILTEMEYLNLLRPADWQKFFQKDSISAILAEHVWEHLTPEEGCAAAKICFEYLRPGGRLRLAIPDGFNSNAEYHAWVRPGGVGPGAYDHKVLYTHETLERVLIEAGFRVELLEYFDSSGEFHFTDWNPTEGMVHRSRRFDERNQNGPLKYTSLIVDAWKPAAIAGD